MGTGLPFSRIFQVASSLQLPNCAAYFISLDVEMNSEKIHLAVFPSTVLYVEQENACVILSLSFVRVIFFLKAIQIRSAQIVPFLSSSIFSLQVCKSVVDLAYSYVL